MIQTLPTVGFGSFGSIPGIVIRGMVITPPTPATGAIIVDRVWFSDVVDQCQFSDIEDTAYFADIVDEANFN